PMSPYIRTIHTDYTARIAPAAPPPGPSSFSPAPSYTRRIRRRTAAPPPPPRTSCAYIKFDPFYDEPTEHTAPPPLTPVLYRTPSRLVPPSLSLPRTAPIAPPRSRAPLTLPPPPPTPAPAPAPAQRQAHVDPNARSRLVAGILLNRVHAIGRPMRRRSLDGPREYVKSGLSSVISVEA
ncbi:hypothetical protein C0992_005139, partial [Termitomyces sp. T32_za158]